MLLVVDISRVIDQQCRDAVVDPVGATQPRVVHLLVTDHQQRTVILRAGQQRQQEGAQTGFV